MTRKDFEAIAAAVRATGLLAARDNSAKRADGAADALDCVARHLADHLATTNPRFDRARFLSACVPPRTLRCGMHAECVEPVSHVDEKGFTYCAGHGAARRTFCRCRKLTATESRTLQSGGAVAY
jgi:hypothetical protein